MLTGTPLDLTPFGSVLSALGGLYWVIAAGALWWAWKRAASRKSAWLRVGVVALAFGLLPLISRLNVAPTPHDKAMALFAERCKTAGETIHRTVDDVDGVVWMKWREPYSNAGNFAEQFKMNDPAGRDCGAESCIAALLRVSQDAVFNPQEAERHSKGYRFVETLDPVDQRLYRYTARLGHNWTAEDVEKHKRETGREVSMHSYRMQIVRMPIEKFSARFGIAWEDISTEEDRKLWVAGGKLRLVDLSSNEPLAERVGYVVDQGQGSQEGGVHPGCSQEKRRVPH